jgi:type IV secretory pathway VirB2 component (pilin)
MIPSLQKKAAALAVALALAAGPAAAQVGGGGNAGWLSGLWQAFLTNVAPGLGIAAIAVIGILALGARLGLIIVCGVVVGIYIITHADTIYGLISVAG